MREALYLPDAAVAYDSYLKNGNPSEAGQARSPCVCRQSVITGVI